jgi:hypothetical protein
LRSLVLAAYLDGIAYISSLDHADHYGRASR